MMHPTYDLLMFFDFMLHIIYTKIFLKSNKKINAFYKLKKSKNLGKYFIGSRYQPGSTRYPVKRFIDKLMYCQL